MERASAPGRRTSTGRVASFGRRQEALAALARRALSGATMPDLGAHAVDAVADALNVPVVAILAIPRDGDRSDFLADHGLGTTSGDASWIALTDASWPVDDGTVSNLLEDPFSSRSGGLGGRSALPDGVLAAGRAGAATIRLAGRPVAILAAASRDGAAATGTARTFLREVAEILGLALGRASDENALQQAHDARFQGLIDSDANGLLMVDESGRIMEANRRAAGLFGYAPDELVGTSIERLVPDRVRPIHARHRATYSADPSTRPMGVGRDLTARRKDGTEFPVEIGLSSFEVGGRRLVTAIVADITARKGLEEQLLQAQKMESVGRLAGGVAHDFNNILTTISGYSHLLLGELGDSGHELDRDELARNVGFVRDAASRAASLTQQLLAFSRRQVLRPQIIDLNRTVAEIEPMLRPLLGERIEIVHVLDPSVGRLRADPGQLDQIIVNLAVNARDAMPDGGTLTIETQNATFDEGYAIEHFDVTAGSYVVLAVSDTGVGMDRETRAHVFEPFFTTKELGKGTGLGLATIYGIVRQSGGHIWLYSEPGQGTTFKIYLPRTDDLVPQAGSRSVSSAPGRRKGTILLVEDDDSVRQYARIVLARAGYDVIEASNGADAFDLVADRAEPLAALVTDVVMPRMTGPQLVERLMDREPGLPVVYVSGYTSEAVDAQGMLGPNAVFLGKPFSSESLHAKLAEAFQARRPTAAGGTARED